jgi:orotidine-5'-phosphate decarboxylase
LGFAQRLRDAVGRVGSPALVGIDPRGSWLPAGYRERFEPSLGGEAGAFSAFGRDVIDVVAGRAAAVKFQCAFYERLGPAGMQALDESTRYARSQGLLVIVDGKRNDIGTTAEAYAQAYLGQGARHTAGWAADALTVNPYLGSDGIAPFAEMAAASDTGVFVLVRTSNASAREFQDLVADGKPVYRHVAEQLAHWAEPYRDASGYSLLGAVVGATYPAELAELREALPGVIFLVAGYGAQGGTAADVAPAFDAEGFGALINNSRGLVFAYRQEELLRKHGGNWQRCVEDALETMTADLAAFTPAGRLRGRSL